MAGFGQLGLFGPLALEQRYAELSLQVDDAVADYRDGAIKLPGGAVEAAFVDDGKEYPKLVAWLDTFAAQVPIFGETKVAA